MPSGTLFSYTDSAIDKRSIADVIYNIDPDEAILLQVFGFTEANAKKFQLVNWPARRAELLEDRNSPVVSALAEPLDDSELEWDVTAGQGQYFRTGDMVGVYNAAGQIAEKAVVDFVVGDTLTVKARGYGTTNATTHDSERAIRILTRMMPENAPYTKGHTTLTEQPWNHVQILSEAVEASRTSQEVLKYGITDYLNYHTTKLLDDGGSMGKLARMLQGTFYWGERVARDANNDGSMGGFETYVDPTLTIDLNGDPLLRSHVHTLIRNVRDLGGRITDIVCSSFGIEKFTQMYDGYITTTRDETIGGHEIRSILTPHGKVNLLYDWMCPGDRYYFVNREKIGWLPLTAFFQSDVYTQRDGVAVDVIGEYTFLMCGADRTHGMIREASITV